ncbi:MAG: AAA family ATPase [Gammaproteobacteria bacterium]|nr:AAA family ATPase [Gammaproteobacteria bacterium]
MPGISDQIRRLAVPVSDLRRICEPLAIDTKAGEKKPAAAAYLGQQRAIDAIRFGIQMDREGYNVFVLGPLGSHRHGLVEELAKERAREKGAPDDWCYINNFSDPERPKALRLPPGRSVEFRDKMRALIEEIRLAIPAAFESDDYSNQLKALEAETQKEVEEQWRSLNEQAAREGIAVLQTPTGYVLAPLSDDKVIDDKEFDKLPKARRKSIKKAIKLLSEELKARIETIPKLRKHHHERVRELDQSVTAHAVSVLLDDLKRTYEPFPNVISYLDEVQQDIIENAQDFRRSEEPALPFLSHDSSALFATYEVNLVVSNEFGASAPIIYEPNPSYPNLIGKVEHRAEMGALLTDFRMIRSGALLQANGGYLVLDIHRVLGRPFVWEALKQALFTKQVRIESPAETLGFAGTTMLKPEPIPLDLKIMLIGERWLYYLLCAYDAEFSGLFKVAADLDDDVERTLGNVEAYARLIGERVQQRDLLRFSREAIQRVIEQRARHAEDSERLSMHMRSLDDLLMQADHWARRRDADHVDVEDVIEAIRQRDRRLDRVQSKVVDAIKRGTLLIDTSGDCVGQVNGLSVFDLGEARFGHPVRITATTRVGTGEVVDIEREVKLGGAIHSKGVLILSAALSARYAPEMPLSLHGSVVFEQSYGGVEGDSASVAELCALLSSISGVPIRQNLAVTGSINQLGRVQAVGGINEKIEGFYEVCRERGLDGSHGVIIPRDNIKHLMLKEAVVDAVQNKQFSVYAVQHIDEAVAILTDTAAGERDESGQFPEDTVNRKVEDRLIKYAKGRKQFSAHRDRDEQHK